MCVLRTSIALGCGFALLLAAACGSSESDPQPAAPLGGRGGSGGTAGNDAAGATDGSGGSSATGGSGGSGATGGSGGSSATGGSGGSSATGGSGGTAGTLSDGGPDADAPGPKLAFRYVTNSVVLPISRTDFALDLNGDGTPDNRFGNIVGALSQQGLDLQGEQRDNVAAGTGLELLRFEASDATLEDDPTASVTLFRAANTPSPDFTGAGTFTVEGAVRNELAGALAGGVFTSNAPPAGVPPTKLSVKVAFFGDLPLTAARVSFRASASGLVEGKIHGAVMQADVTAIVVPALAQRFDALAKESPCSLMCSQVKQLFDADLNGTITAQEVGSNALISSLLAPDVDLLDASGNYRPGAANTEKESLSVGIGFGAVRANFVP